MQNSEFSQEEKKHLPQSIDLLKNAKDQEDGILAVQEIKVTVHRMRRQLTIAEDAIWKLQRFLEENKDKKIAGTCMMEDVTFTEKINEAIRVLEGIF